MPARKARDVKSAAPSPSPALRSSRSRSQLSATDDEASRVPPVIEAEETDDTDNTGAEESSVVDEHGDEDEGADVDGAEDSGASSSKPSLKDRQAKLRELRLRMVSTPYHHHIYLY